MFICLEQGADLHMAQLMPLPLTVSCFSKIQIGLPFWYRLTRVVPDKGPLNGCVCVFLGQRTNSLPPLDCVTKGRLGSGQGCNERLRGGAWVVGVAQRGVGGDSLL